MLAATACMAAAMAFATAGAFAEDAPSGRAIATQGTANGVPACVGCHGAQGQGNTAAGFPRLAGVGADYLSAQLAAFADGRRQNSVMQPIARNLSPDERTSVSTYFSGLPSPSTVGGGDAAEPSPSDTGAWLAVRGRWGQGLPACAQCHGPGGTGVGGLFPPLAGQPAAYIEAQLHDWKDGKRPPGALALMSVIASKLSDADMAAVAKHYAQQTGADTSAGK
ncbi:c-type cytochrome [Burkholderia guangdongensis]|uniref:c-type cytochrome n=1 Tax=Burkholderia guangdongensis TaxID=1792500 RepID=UPI001FE7CEA1|nr:c-type cytochrome [Burkholderia guangdongensis]